ncbi:MAG: AsmA family protein [Gammaproteobacteria bacterium]|nr:AsmA family protein [Gammaproteobacteria bacterium]
MIKIKIKKSRKKIIYAISAIILLPIIVLLLIFTFVNPNSYKSRVIAIASSTIHREITIDGDLKWSIFPLGITLNDFKVANDPIFTPQYIVTANQATISLEILPLLSGNYHIKFLNLKDTVINLAKNKNDYTNWQSISNTSNTEDKNSETTPQIKSATQSYSSAFSISEIKITNGVLNWEDPEERIEFKNINLQGNDLDYLGTSPIRLKGSFDTYVKSQQANIKTKLDLKAKLVQNDTNTLDKIDIDLYNLYFQLGGNSFPNNPEFTIKSKAQLSPSSKSFNFSELQANLNNLELTSDLNGIYDRDNPSATSINGKIQITDGDLDAFFKGLNTDVPTNFYKKLLGTLTFSTKNKFISINPLDIKLDKDHLRGAVKINTATAPYAVTASIKSDTLNIDKLLANKTTTKESKNSSKSANSANSANSAKAEQKKNNPDEIFSSSTRTALKNLDFNITASINNLIYKELALTNFSSNVNIKNQKINSQTKFIVYNGPAVLNTSIDLVPASPSWQGKFSINNFQIEKFMREKLDSKRWIGNTNLNLDYQTVGNNSQQLLNNLNGNVSLELTNGYLNGIDLFNIFSMVNNKLDVSPDRIINLAKSALSLLTKHPSLVNDDKTKLLDMEATGKITQGILYNNDLLADTPLLKATGKGQINIPNHTINYTVFLTDKSNKANLNIPIVLTGDLFEPNYDVNVAALLNSDLFKSILRKNIKSLPKNLMLDKIPVIDNILERL